MKTITALTFPITVAEMFFEPTTATFINISNQVFSILKLSILTTLYHKIILKYTYIKIILEIFMRNKNNKHLGIEIDPELHHKLRYISKYYGRSANGEILYLIRQEIKAFEKSEGEIELPETLKEN